MKITNKMGLPEALVQAVSTQKHNKEGQYSATTLLKGACETVLTKRHWDEIEVDASESIWTVFGTATHSIFEKQKDNTFKEEQFSVPVGNSIVTGRVDSYDLETETIVDWKTASVWKVQFNDFSDWYKQGMVYAWLMKKSGLNVKRCKFIALLKDHSKSKARQSAEYPQAPVHIYQFDVTEKALQDIEAFITNKVQELELAEKVADEKLVPCTAEERWATEDKWAIMKDGRKTALKLCDSEAEAEEYKATKGGDYIEFRQGESKKCIDGYCSCREFCPFYKNLKN